MTSSFILMHYWRNHLNREWMTGSALSTGDTARRSCLERLANPTLHARNVCRDYIFALSGLWLAYGDVAGLLSLVSGCRPTWRMLAVAR